MSARLRTAWMLGLTGLLGLAAGGCKKDARRDVLGELKTKLSEIRKQLVDLAPTLPEVGAVTAWKVPDGALEIDDDDAAQDNTIIIGLETLRAPNDLRKDDPLESPFVYVHRFLGCLRDAADGSESGALPAEPSYRATCERAAAARYALVYRVVKSVPAKFEKPTGNELAYEPGSLAVEWFVIDLGAPEARKVEVIGELVTLAATPDAMTIEVDVGAPPGLVEARTQAARALMDVSRDQLVAALQGKAKHVDLDPTKP